MTKPMLFLLYNAVLELRYVEQLLTERRAVARAKA